MENEKINKRIISYSQLSTYNQCNYKWYLTYVKKLSKSGSSIHLVFGTAMHETLQKYLDVMYNKSVKDADALDLNEILLQEMTKAFESGIITEELTEENKTQQYANSFEFINKDTNNKWRKILPSNQDEMEEFYKDGVAIIDFFKKKRKDYFNKKGYELTGIEFPVELNMPKNLLFYGKLDVVLYDTIADKYKIKDFKTSTKGWRDYHKKDKNKTNQLLLYKAFYSKILDVPIEKIDVEFIILKRKLYENVDFPQKRIQRFSPSEGSVSINNALQSLHEFIETCFNNDGTYNINRSYKKNVTKLCDWCEFYENGICDKQN